MACHQFSAKSLYKPVLGYQLEILSAKWQLFFLSLNVLKIIPCNIQKKPNDNLFNI